MQMKLSWINDLLVFVALLIAQATILNRIHLFDCATPLFYVYFVLPRRRNDSRWSTLLWCFALGMCVDMFTNTPGVAAASMTLVAFLQPYLLSLIIPRDSSDDFQPSFATLGTAKYLWYSAILVCLYCLTFFAIEAFSFFNWLHWLECAGGSAVLTLLFVYVTENIVRRK